MLQTQKNEKFSFICTFKLSKQIVLGPTSNSQEEIQEALIDLEPGDVLKLQAGEYFFEDGISLDVDDVIFEGSGIDDTILNFSNPNIRCTRFTHNF